MQNKKLLFIVGGIVIIAIIVAAYLFASGNLFKDLLTAPIESSDEKIEIPSLGVYPIVTKDKKEIIAISPDKLDLKVSEIEEFKDLEEPAELPIIEPILLGDEEPVREVTPEEEFRELSPDIIEDILSPEEAPEVAKLEEPLSEKLPSIPDIFLPEEKQGDKELTIDELPLPLTETTIIATETDTTCADFTDIPFDDPDCVAITHMKNIGAITGNPDGTFAPEMLLQRDHIIKIIMEASGSYDPNIDACAEEKNRFLDIDATKWVYPYACQAKAQEIIEGYPDGYYRSARYVNRVEFLKTALLNIDKVATPSVNSTSYIDVTPGEWYAGYAKRSLDLSLFLGESLFPSDYVTRREAARAIYKLIKSIE